MLSGIPMQLLQLGSLIVNPILKRFFAKTPRERLAIDGQLCYALLACVVSCMSCAAPPAFSYIQPLSGLVVLFLIGFMYATVTPFISIFMLGYFAFAYLAYKFQVCCFLCSFVASAAILCL